MFPLFSLVDHQPLCFYLMFGNTYSLHSSFVSRNPTTTHCNNMFWSVPCSALFADQQPLCFKCFPSQQPLCFISIPQRLFSFCFAFTFTFQNVSGRPAAFIRFKCFQVDQQPLCVSLCFLSFLNHHFFICFLSSLPPFFFFFDWWTSSVQFRSVQFSSVQLIFEPGRIKRSGIENPLPIGFVRQCHANQQQMNVRCINIRFSISMNIFDLQIFSNMHDCERIPSDHRLLCLTIWSLKIRISPSAIWRMQILKNA